MCQANFRFCDYSHIQRRKYIAGCLESVLQQDYPGIEHIVLDGRSTDQTVDILRRYDDRVEYWASEPDN
ncbi:MAG: glycosyltransferase [Acidobacteriaceae bacterium]